jgi:hypothetical protein
MRKLRAELRIPRRYTIMKNALAELQDAPELLSRLEQTRARLAE